MNLAQRVILPLDRQRRRRAGEIDRVDRGLDLRRNGRCLAASGNAGGGEGVIARRPDCAVIALAVPDEALVADIE